MSGRAGGAGRRAASSAPTSATSCWPGATRWSASTTSRPAAGPTSPTSTDHPAFTLVEADISTWHPGRRRRSTGVFNLASPASPARLPGPPARDPGRGQRGDPPRPRAGRPARGPVPPGLHQRGLRRPRGPPPDRGVLGQRQPGRAPQRLRRGQALRRGPDHGPPPRPGHRRRPSSGSSTPTDPGCGPTTAGWCPTSSLQAMRGEPLTVYGDGSQTRSLCYVERRGARAAGPVRLRPHRAGQHRQPGRVHRARAGPDGHRAARVLVLDRRHRPLPADDPTRRRPDIAVARAGAGLGADHPACADGPGPHGRRAVAETTAGCGPDGSGPPSTGLRRGHNGTRWRGPMPAGDPMPGRPERGRPRSTEHDGDDEGGVGPGADGQRPAPTGTGCCRSSCPSSTSGPRWPR